MYSHDMQVMSAAVTGAAPGDAYDTENVATGAGIFQHTIAVSAAALSQHPEGALARSTNAGLTHGFERVAIMLYSLSLFEQYVFRRVLHCAHPLSQRCFMLWRLTIHCTCCCPVLFALCERFGVRAGRRSPFSASASCWHTRKNTFSLWTSYSTAWTRYAPAAAYASRQSHTCVNTMPLQW